MDAHASFLAARQRHPASPPPFLGPTVARLRAVQLCRTQTAAPVAAAVAHPRGWPLVGVAGLLDSIAQR